MKEQPAPGIDCPFCGRNSAVRWPQRAFRECEQCGLLFVHPCPTSSELEELYKNSWTAPKLNTAETGGMTPGLAETLVNRLETELAKTGLSTVRGQTILEFGAGSGTMVKAMKQRGADVWAVEPYGCEILTNSGIQAVPQISNLPSGLAFEGIVTFDVVEHLEEPWLVLSELKTKLKPGGWLLVSTPNTRGLNAVLAGSHWRELNNRGHIRLFSPKALSLSLKYAGFLQVRRLRWFVNYDDPFPRSLIHYTMQAFGIDGALRVLATAPVDSA